MGWGSTVKNAPLVTKQPIVTVPRQNIQRAKIDWKRLVVLDMETYYDTEYTLRKMSTSEYVRDPRFKAHMVGVKVGTAKTKVIPAAKIKAFLKTIDWSSYGLLCHNAPFDGFILSHHYGVVPKFYYDTLAMARGLHSNDIGAGLDEVARFYGRGSKLEGILESSKGIRDLPRELYERMADYCAQDVDLTLAIFKDMLEHFPMDELRLVNLTTALFADPKLKVDIERVEKEYYREKEFKENLLISFLGTPKTVERLLKADITEFQRQVKGVWQFRKKDLDDLKMKPEEVTVRDMLLLEAKRKISSSEQFADILRAEGVDPPLKISPTWIKKRPDERSDDDKYTYAFAKDDLEFLALREVSQKLSDLVDLRLAVKSTQGLTRAERFLKAGMNGWSLPVLLHYYGAHCVTGDVEVLTRQGWQRICDWKGGEIAQVRSDQSIEFLPADLFEGPLAYEWLEVNAPYMKGYFTLGHTMPYLKHGSMQWATAKAGDFADASSRYVPLAGQMIGDGAITAAQMRVLAMVQADGSFETDTSIGRRLAIFVKKPRKILRARMLLQEAGICFEEQTYESWPGYVRFIIRERNYPAWLTPERKFFGPWLLDSTEQAREALINELQHWDGWIWGGQHCYSTSDKVNADWVATLCHLAGRCASISTRPAEGNRRTNYIVAIRQRSHGLVRKEHMQVQEYVAPMRTYCTVTQTGFWLARSQGRIFVTGNTGRWSAGNKMNLQNLERGGELRMSILAPTGYMIAVNDSGQIEARVNAWISGQDDLLESFRAADRFEASQAKLPKDQRKVATGEQRDAYCKFADTIYGREITKKDEMERFVGKVGVLGLGYMMGAPKLQMTLAKGALGGPPVFFELDMCQKIVQAYRRKNHKIAAFWKLCTSIIEDMAAGREGSYKCLHWEKERIWLPNGMSLKYPGLKCENNGEWDEWSYLRKGARTKIYGGLLCENIVQALARIIIGEQMLMIAEKYRVVMTTHDEVSAIVKKAQAKTAFAFMQKCMATAPAWCADIPLNSEGKVESYYAK